MLSRMPLQVKCKRQEAQTQFVVGLWSKKGVSRNPTSGNTRVIDLQSGTFPPEHSLRNRCACFHDLWISCQSKITPSISDVVAIKRSHLCK